MLKIIVGLLYAYSILAFAQSNGVPINKNPSNIQPIVIIDGSKLINPPKNASQPNGANTTPPIPSKSESAPPENNVRIGSNGQYVDSAKSEQINSKGQICTTLSGKKTCN